MKGSLFSVLVLVGLLFLVSCGLSTTEQVRIKYAKANTYFKNDNFNDAKLVIDTIISSYASQKDYVLKAKMLLHNINVNEQERDIQFLDSALQKKQNVLDKLMKNFVVSKAYGAKNILIHKRQQTKNSYSRTYLRTHLDLEGNFYISSYYSGNHYIDHKQIKVYYKGKSVLSAVIPEDGFNNRKFNDGGVYWEIVNYKNGKDNGVVDFIAKNVSKSLKVEYIGKKHYYIVLEKYDKEAISDGYEISFVLKEVTRIKKQIKSAKLELNKLNKKKFIE